MPTLDALNALDAGLRSSNRQIAEGQLRSSYEAAPSPGCSDGLCPERAPAVARVGSVRPAAHAALDAASGGGAGAKGGAGKWALGGAAVAGLAASGLGGKLFGALLGALLGGGIVGILLWSAIGAGAGLMLAKGFKKR
jgi:hypothetical protein